MYFVCQNIDLKGLLVSFTKFLEKSNVDSEILFNSDLKQGNSKIPKTGSNHQIAHPVLDIFRPYLRSELKMN